MPIKRPRVASQFGSAQHDIKIKSFSALHSLATIPKIWILTKKCFDVYNDTWLPVNKDLGSQVHCFSKALGRSRPRHQKFVQQVIFFLTCSYQGPILSEWINFNLSMDKYIHHKTWYEIVYLIPNNRWILGMLKWFHLTLYWSYPSIDCYSLIIRSDSWGNKKYWWICQGENTSKFKNFGTIMCRIQASG